MEPPRSPSPTPRQAPATDRHGRPGRRPAVTVLLVEDDATVREAACTVLEQSGYRVLSAATDDQALWLWDRHADQIDLMITDLMIPTHSTGLDLARRFRAQKPSLPVILTSGFGRDIGDDDPDFPRDLPFLQKPFTPACLRQAIAAVLAPHS